MKRRAFLKLISVAAIAPLILATAPKKHLTLAMLRKCAKELKKADESNKVTINGNKYYLFYDALIDPTHIWAKEMARLQNEAMDKMIIDSLLRT